MLSNQAVSGKILQWNKSMQKAYQLSLVSLSLKLLTILTGNYNQIMELILWQVVAVSVNLLIVELSVNQEDTQHLVQ